MQIDIQFNKKTANKDRSNLFNILGKAVTTISIPLMIFGAYDHFSNVFKAPEERISPEDKTRKLAFASLINSIILSSVGIAARKKYVLEKNMQPQFVSDDKNLDLINDIIQRDKEDAIRSKPSFDDRVKNSEIVELPDFPGPRKIYPFLFLTPDEIEELPPYAKCSAYLAQIKCMKYFIFEEHNRGYMAHYHPNIPVAEKHPSGCPLHHYEDMIDVLKRDYQVAIEHFTKFATGLCLKVEEKINEDQVREEIDKKIKNNGWRTALLAAAAPIIPALYSNVDAAVKNFVSKPLIVTPDTLQNDIITDLERCALMICDQRSALSFLNIQNTRSTDCRIVHSSLNLNRAP